MSNWLKTVNRINADRYTIPDGWETKEQVAISLQCDPDRVNDVLKPGLAEGAFERQEFPVWDAKSRMAKRVTCYRIVESGQEPVKPIKSGYRVVEAKKIPVTDRDERIRQAIIKYRELTDYGVSRHLNNVKAAEVSAVRRANGL